jgi:hypothetical protein
MHVRQIWKYSFFKFQFGTIQGFLQIQRSYELLIPSVNDCLVNLLKFCSRKKIWSKVFFFSSLVFTCLKLMSANLRGFICFNIEHLFSVENIFRENELFSVVWLKF